MDKNGGGVLYLEWAKSIDVVGVQVSGPGEVDVGF